MAPPIANMTNIALRGPKCSTKRKRGYWHSIAPNILAVRKIPIKYVKRLGKISAMILIPPIKENVPPQKPQMKRAIHCIVKLSLRNNKSDPTIVPTNAKISENRKGKRSKA